MAKILKKGVNNDYVTILQEILNEKCKANPKLKPDGDFGQATEKAVAAFQSKYKIKGDKKGTVGPETAAKLLEITSKAKKLAVYCGVVAEEKAEEKKEAKPEKMEPLWDLAVRHDVIANMLQITKRKGTGIWSNLFNDGKKATICHNWLNGYGKGYADYGRKQSWKKWAIFTKGQIHPNYAKDIAEYLAPLWPFYELDAKFAHCIPSALVTALPVNVDLKTKDVESAIKRSGAIRVLLFASLSNAGTKHMHNLSGASGQAIAKHTAEYFYKHCKDAVKTLLTESGRKDLLKKAGLA
ncbi:hypothetical protein M2103_000962 [Ereboglobus sp. PH5-5]|uniref:peptidoglycan-binding domain-containing protein n=1 Tax=Ereboglobus sp. PH5-5 TaxID=2940529 RepID=UPI002406D804|nr:peptidoglycan-binding protein [Ereboglobus sp. PH5-5]MDF9832748.1 hypothetical protein [Ereboglobus sp. PH5-5]